MEALVEQAIMCPYCGETITVLVDTTVVKQSYVEDCQVCCQPIILDIDGSQEDEVLLSGRRENE